MKLLFQKIKFYKIFNIKNKLSFRLELFDWLRIYFIIFIDYLKLAMDNPYNRLVPEPDLIYNKKKQLKYIIKKILEKEIQNKEGYRI